MSGVSVAQPDISLHLDAQGVIRDATFSEMIGEEDVRALLGRSWLETVDVSGAEKARRLLSDARLSGVPLFRHVVQRFPSGRELAMEYSAIKVSGNAGELMVLGRSLQAVADVQTRLVAAQQAQEGEHWKLRDIETRHRLLFDASHEAMLAIGASFRVIEVNPAAKRALGLSEGCVFTDHLAPGEHGQFVSLLQRVREFGGAPGILLHFGPELKAWAVRASLNAIGDEAQYVLHVTPIGFPSAPEAPAVVPWEALIEQLPDGFVVADGDGRVLQANRAFLDLVQAGAAGAVQGHGLGRWMAHPGADAGVLFAMMRRDATVRSFQTVLHGELGAEIVVEVSGAGHGAGGAALFGIAIRDVGRRVAPASSCAVDSMSGVVDLVARQLGRAPLSQVVQSAVDTIERSMITAALERVAGNRTAAAELLGLSRQSLHNKLNRHAAENRVAGATDANP